MAIVHVRNNVDDNVEQSKEIDTRFQSAQAAKKAHEAFEAQFRHGAVPDDMPTVTLEGAPKNIVHALRDSGLVSSGSEAQRSIAQRGVRVDGTRVEDRTLELEAGTYILQVGKRRFARVTLKP